MFSNEINAFRHGELMAFGTVIQHRKSIIVALDKQDDYGRDPTDNGEKGKNQDRYGVHCLPDRVSDGKPDAPPDIAEQLLETEREVFSFDNRFRFLTEVSK